MELPPPLWEQAYAADPYIQTDSLGKKATRSFVWLPYTQRTITFGFAGHSGGNGTWNCSNHSSAYLAAAKINKIKRWDIHINGGKADDGYCFTINGRSFFIGHYDRSGSWSGQLFDDSQADAGGFTIYFGSFDTGGSQYYNPAGNATMNFYYQ